MEHQQSSTFDWHGFERHDCPKRWERPWIVGRNWHHSWDCNRRISSYFVINVRLKQNTYVVILSWYDLISTFGLKARALSRATCDFDFPTCSLWKRNWRFKLLTSIVSKSIWNWIFIRFSWFVSRTKDLQFQYPWNQTWPSSLKSHIQFHRLQQLKSWMFWFCRPDSEQIHHQRRLPWFLWGFRSLNTSFWSISNIYVANYDFNQFCSRIC